ncbi:MAG: lytic murein transglycosylase family protein, partial [Hyphomicrobiales bacterium]|nr:lytic murein transglycosylase family protein [Hyphomicrobiales bacterium]
MNRIASLLHPSCRSRVALLGSLGLGLLSSVSPASAQFQSCLAELRGTAASQGVSGAVFDRTMRGVEPDPKIIELMNNQPEFKTPIWDYLATLVDNEKVAEGRALLRRHDAVLRAAEQKFGVDRHAVLA